MMAIGRISLVERLDLGCKYGYRRITLLALYTSYSSLCFSAQPSISNTTQGLIVKNLSTNLLLGWWIPVRKEQMMIISNKLAE